MALALECLAGARGDSAASVRNGWSKWGTGAARVPPTHPMGTLKPRQGAGGEMRALMELITPL